MDALTSDRVRAAFARIEEAPAAERADLLAALDDDIRAEVQSLLQALDDAGGFLSRPDGAAPHVGSLVGPYAAGRRDRTRRHGRGLSRLAAGRRIRPGRRDQDCDRPLSGARGRASLHPRAPDSRPPRPPAYRSAARRWTGQRLPLLRHGAGRGIAHHRIGLVPSARRSAPPLWRRLQRRALRAPAADPPSRSEAREHRRDRRRAGESARLRDRSHPSRGRRRVHRCDDDGASALVRLREPRTAARRAAIACLGHLRAGRAVVRVGDRRQPAVSSRARPSRRRSGASSTRPRRRRAASFARCRAISTRS